MHSAITKFDIISSLVLTCKILSYLQPLAKFLQARSLNLKRAFDTISVVKDTLKDVRGNIDNKCYVRGNIDNKCLEWYNQAVAVAGKVNVVPSRPRIVRRQTLRINAPASNTILQ